MLTERTTRFTLLFKLSDKSAPTMTEAMTKVVRKLPVELNRSLALDQGREFAGHVTFTVATDIQIYFCDPTSPWQRGTAENTVGLLRQYLPKNGDLSVFTQGELNQIARKLNGRSRKALDWLKPAEAYSELVGVATTK